MACQFIADWENEGKKFKFYTDCKIYKAKFVPSGGIIFTGKRIMP
jgi:hypothetical protein